MRACSPSFASRLALPCPASRLPSRISPSASIELASSSSAGRRSLAFAAMSASTSSSSPLPFDGSARRGLLHPRISDPSPTPPAGEAPPPVRAAQQRCARCGGELSVAWLEGRWRHACRGGGGPAASAPAPSSAVAPLPSGESGGGGGCGAIAYTNPLLVVGAIITDVDDALSSGGESLGGGGSGGSGERKAPRVLLCKRAIEPRKGSWTLPAGYLELGESAAEGAARETWEEARARVEIFAPYFHADVPAIGQTYLLFRGKLVKSKDDEEKAFSPGPESQEVALFGLDEVPKLDLAFSAVATALRLFTEDVERHGQFHYHHGTILKHPGGAPNAGTLVDHFAMPISKS